MEAIAFAFMTCPRNDTNVLFLKIIFNKYVDNSKSMNFSEIVVSDYALHAVAVSQMTEQCNVAYRLMRAGFLLAYCQWLLKPFKDSAPYSVARYSTIPVLQRV